MKSKRTLKTSVKTKASTKKAQQPVKKTTKSQAKKPLAKKVSLKKPKTALKSIKSKEKIKKSKIENRPMISKMSEFEKCLILAALINQKRMIDIKFSLIPIPDINSSSLASVRNILGQYDFNVKDIQRGVKSIQMSPEFKAAFPANEIKEIELKLTDAKDINLIKELFALAGNEAKKIIFIADRDAHDIQKTTLEKFALKKGFIALQDLPEHAQNQDLKQHTHKQILINLNYQKMGRGFNNFQRFSGIKHRGRG